MGYAVIHGAIDETTPSGNEEVGDLLQTSNEAREIKDPRDLVELTGWHRDYARSRLREASTLKVARPPQTRASKFSPPVFRALRTCWMLTRRPAGKRLTPMLAHVVP